MRESEQSAFAASAHRELCGRGIEKLAGDGVDQSDAPAVLLEDDDPIAGQRLDSGG